ncbi:MAG: MaoC/PaaZ C-terminal domain-containing protein [Alphaproteobacteria bacterium]|jgi:acyl dehydratase|nr:MaoC/PaaZ C-terminal domain-containing protein [Alphaproteobacteria bacterium]
MSDLPISIGDGATFAKTVGESDIYGFAGITGDFAAPHVNAEFMKNSQYGERVAHGALLVGFMSTASALLAGRVIEANGGLTPMSIGYDRVRFTEAVKIGDTITVVYEIKELEPERRRSRATLTATNQDGVVVGVGEHIMKWLVNP